MRIITCSIFSLDLVLTSVTRSKRMCASGMGRIWLGILIEVLMPSKWPKQLKQ